MANRDFTKAPEQILIDQINEDNTTTFTPALLEFGVPATDAGAKNTKVVITAAVGSGYTGTRDIFYNRVDLATVPGARSTIFQVGNADQLSELVPEINTAYGINLTTDDFTEAAIPAFPGQMPHETQTIDLVAKATSLIWRGQVTLTLNANDIALSAAIPTNELNGLTYVQP